MSRDIPFFEMFTELRLSAPLRLKLAGAELTGACIDQTAMTITVHLRVRMPYCFVDKKYPGVPRIYLREVEAGKPFSVRGTEILPVAVMHGICNGYAYDAGRLV